jgi:hypothetical protein
LTTFLFFALPLFSQSPIYFDESASDRLRVGNSIYELSLSKANGGILAVRDKAANAIILSGSGCLWSAAENYPAPPAGSVSGCSFGPSGPNRFRYAWNAANSTLTLSYTSPRAAAKQVNVVVTLALTAGPALDLRITLDNQSGGALNWVALPSGLEFNADQVQAAYLPFALPGVRLKPEFFKQHRSSTSIYPSRNAAMDFLALDVAGGRFALYLVNPLGPLQPAVLGFVSTGPQPLVAHGLPNWTPNGRRFTSPIVRMRIGQPVRETILAYRADNAIAAYPCIEEKLGARFSKLARAPLVKAHIEKPFQEYSRLLSQLDAPALIHPVAFQSPGFDRGYPDFLPPDPRWGTIADFRSFVETAHAQGFLVMPYMNPTWWNEDSATMRNLAPLTVAGVAVQDLKGQPAFEKYGANSGYAISPYVPFVHDRLARLMFQWRDDVPVDFVFEDQIGARRWLPDLNPAEPTPVSYTDGWYEHTSIYSFWGLMTEDGWDRIAATEAGFCGSALTGAKKFDPQVALWGPENRANTSLGRGNWEPYPLAVWAFHDKVMFYQHDLEMHLTARDLEVITWNLLFGVNFSYIFPGLGGGTPPDVIDLTNALQRALGPAYAGRVLTDFTDLAPGVVRSTFATGLTVIANWNATEPYAVEGCKIVPTGCLARTKSVLAGVFQDTFNNHPLTAGAHYLIVEHAPGAVMVRQPVGADTPLAIDAPPSAKVYAVERSGHRLGEVPASAQGGQIVFEYHRQFGNRPVEHYEAVAIMKAGD